MRDEDYILINSKNASSKEINPVTAKILWSLLIFVIVTIGVGTVIIMQGQI